MGYPLYRDVKIWSPDGLTKGEKLAALVLADDANDKTRLTFSSTEDPEIMRQALVPDDRAMRRILAALLTQKVIERAASGHNGKVAKFRFLHLSPEGCPGAPECMCPLAKPVQDEPAAGDTSEDVGGSKSPAYSDKQAASKAGENHPATNGVGGRFSAGRRVKTTRPTPSTSSTTSSTAPAGKPASGQRKPGKHQVADDLTAAFWEHHGKGRAQPFIAVRSVIRAAIGNGVERDDLARALDRCAREGRSISGATLDIALGALKRAGSSQQRTGARSDLPDDDDIDNATPEDIV